MSLLSDTNHSPQRVFALLRLLDAQGGELDFETIKSWFKPEFRGRERQVSEGEHVNIRQLLGAATSLSMIESAGQNRYRLVAQVPETLEGFADVVHDHLVGVDWHNPDSIVLEAFAAMVAITENEQGTAWLEVSGKDRAARINAGVRHDSEEGEDENSKRFNSTKASPWKKWIVFLGLGVPMPRGDLYPYPVQRLARETDRVRAEKNAATRLDIDQFLAMVAERLPYLDGGRLFQSAADQIRLPPLGRRLTRVLTGALRDLHDDKQLSLETVGDAKQSYSLTGEPHAVKSVKAVDLMVEAADG